MKQADFFFLKKGKVWKATFLMLCFILFAAVKNGENGTYPSAEIKRSSLSMQNVL